MITITHTSAEGTLATGDTRPHAATFKAHGWRWGRSITAWYVPNSRDRLPDRGRIVRTVNALTAAGAAVTVELDDALAPVAEREARRTERIAQRQEALAAKAERLHAASDAHHARVDAITSQIPLGQPILVGHHSEARARRDQQRIWDGMDKAVAAYDEATETARKAEASARHQTHRESAPATMRRIERLEVELRDLERKRDRASIGSPYHDRLTALIADDEDKLAYWRDHLVALEAAGVKVWGPEDFAPGDLVICRWPYETPRRVVRVNRKSLSVETGYSWTDKVTYDDVTGRIRAGEEGAQP